VVWHPLEETTDEGTLKFYEEAEAVLARTPRHGVPIVLKPARGKKPAEPYTAPLMWKIISELRDDLDLPSMFTLDACRHGGMTELEEAELTDWPAPGVVRSSVKSLRGICQADHEPGAGGDAKALCA
jgi:hypothetical protein